MRAGRVLGERSTSLAMSVSDMIGSAGYPTGRLRDAPAVLRLVVQAERAHPGLLGRASRTFPGLFVRLLACLSVLMWLSARVVAFDRAGAAVVVLPVVGVRGRRASIVLPAVVGVAIVLPTVCVLAASVAWTTDLGFAEVVTALGWILGLGTLIPVVPRVRALRTQQRAIAAAADGGPVVLVGAYFGAAAAPTAAMASAFLDAADRHGVTVLVQSAGEARTRLYRRFGFRVVAIENPVTPQHDARVFLVRYPAGTGHVVIEPDTSLWRRHRR